MFARSFFAKQCRKNARFPVRNAIAAGAPLAPTSNALLDDTAAEFRVNQAIYRSPDCVPKQVIGNVCLPYQPGELPRLENPQSVPPCPKV
jgi:hypothetical protein